MKSGKMVFGGHSVVEVWGILVFQTQWLSLVNYSVICIRVSILKLQI